MGSTREDRLKVDMIVDAQAECFNTLEGMYYEKDVHRKVQHPS